MKKIALVYRDLACGIRLRRLADSGHLQAELFGSIDEFLGRGQLADFACVLLQESLFDRAFQILVESRRDELPVIMLTESDDERLRRSEMGIRGVGHFKEPVAGEVLLHALRSLLRRADSPHGSTSGEATQQFGPDDAEPSASTFSHLPKHTPATRRIQSKNRVET